MIDILAALAPGVVGYVRWIKARLQGRRGAGPFQPYRELWKTLAKGMVIPDSASWIFHAAPFVVSAAILTAATLVPVVIAFQPADRMGDLFVLTALMMLGTVALALGALDTGTAFGGRVEPRDDGRGAHRADAGHRGTRACAHHGIDELGHDYRQATARAGEQLRPRPRAGLRRVLHRDAGRGEPAAG
jgi:hypothetical protein